MVSGLKCQKLSILGIVFSPGYQHSSLFSCDLLLRFHQM
uniref:Uncharacterized protein n=1 Tax=Anguilla anguilla TaxID=7936 RepID=A0A0E9UY68_ANGAN